MDDVYSNMSAAIELQKEQTAVELPYTNGCTDGETVYKDHFISFHNITYTVEQRVCFKKRSPKIILNEVRY